MSNVRDVLERALRQRILMLDGAMGTMIQRQQLDESGFRGTRFADHGQDLQGDNDLLVLTQPQIIEQIHSEYLEAGADIIGATGEVSPDRGRCSAQSTAARCRRSWRPRRGRAPSMPTTRRRPGRPTRAARSAAHREYSPLSLSPRFAARPPPS